jgi:hypothetical protein
MNWESVGVLVEGFGAICVVISLVYLTFELRRNTTAQHDANFSSSVQLSKDFLETLLADSELALVWEKGVAGQELSDAERARFNIAMWSCSRSMQFIYYMAAHGKFPHEEWDGYRESALNMYEGEGSRKWWAEQKWRFSKNFRRFVDQHLEKLDK